MNNFDRLVDAEMAKMTDDIARNIYDGASLLWRVDAEARKKRANQPPVYGPPVPQWEFGPYGDLGVYWHDAGTLQFTTPGWESESVYMTVDHAKELRDMLDRWIGDR